MAHTHETPSVEESFEFTPELRKKFILGGIIGLAMVIIGAFIVNAGIWGPDGFALGHEAAHEAHGGGGEAHHSGVSLINRIVGNLWMNSMLFLGISLIGLFFISYNYVAKAGWYVSIKRVAEAFPAFMLVPAVVLMTLFLIPSTRHMIMHWTHEGIMDPASHHFDHIIASKGWWLNMPFFLVRVVLYFVVWYYLYVKIRKTSLAEDQYGGLDIYHESRKYSRWFLIFFAVTSSTAAWDLSMSVDTHFFSTMFGWYHLASWHVAGLAAIMLVVLTLKKQGYLKAVNDSTLHDLGKLMFGFSIFWTYVWFAQFFLIFYSNLPEETIYFRERFSGYGGRYWVPFLASLILNFVFPFLVLMARGSKRNYTMLRLACWAILIGHWFDFYQMLMPSIAKDQGGIGLIEWGTTMVFVCGFAYSVMTQLSKANLYAKNHPFLEESLHHDI
ncbi:quinol:cytochrome C oxidoreductase [Marinilongibacter aquaticus]|uniref:quinol:cytochrome C oxidoreductase n=1 Tax=Marinilongibacter aquaticus TaxID=2975157 RepID=UPI0021BD3DC6|nr:quinol:cytochrome C oxidoreductase [Marinilongibacter aquaticus]UBM57278.1 quinol:cytochrome C oxidoreductase [Marinilongibacter aquaticus]